MHEGIFVKGNIETRAVNIANYIIEENVTVRQKAKKLVGCRCVILETIYILDKKYRQIILNEKKIICLFEFDYLVWSTF